MPTPSIKIRIDVDYPYASRIRSFLYTGLNIKSGNEYLRNSKIIARMINESPKDLKAYWFFTPKTIPDTELLRLIDNPKHEVALHVVNDPYAELRNLEHKTGKKIGYYTIHGTARLLARIMWRRLRSRAPRIPADFPLQSFHQLPTTGIDSLCYSYSSEKVDEMVRESIRKGHVIYFHPIWLFQRGKLNHRGPFYDVLKRILEDGEKANTTAMRRKIFFTIANDEREYLQNIVPTEELIEQLRRNKADVFTFLERKWCCPLTQSSTSWSVADDNIAVLHLGRYDEWWENIGKKTRNMIRKATKAGIRTEIAEADEKLAKSILKVYNETPIRQERGFPYYGVSLDFVKRHVLSKQDCTYVAAYSEDEIVGFIQLAHGDRMTIISQILSLEEYRDKAVNNALIAKAIEFCANSHIEWIMYGRMGNHPTLDNFKESNGFTKLQLARYFIPLTGKGRLAIKLRLNRELKDTLPPSMKHALFPLYNRMSKTRAKLKLALKRTKAT
jgi:hypothetical protein